jgi:hypothetical protein
MRNVIWPSRIESAAPAHAMTATTALDHKPVEPNTASRQPPTVKKPV